jgi:hypothetical protein
MQRGAFVMLDVLGFKGIWRRADVVDPSQVLRKLEGLLDLAKQHAFERVGMRPRGLLEGTLERFEAILVSDTIAAGLVLKESTFDRAVKHVGPEQAAISLGAMTVNAAAQFVDEVICAAAEGPVPLAIRGAIAWGEFVLHERCMIGPAVDEAAECGNAAEAAIVFCTPSALQATEKGLRAEFGRGSLVPWAVPMKGGGSFNTLAVAPFDVDVNSALAVWTAIEPTFKPRRLEIELKRQRSSEFFRRAIDAFSETQAVRKEFARLAPSLLKLATVAPTSPAPEGDGNVEAPRADGDGDHGT